MKTLRFLIFGWLVATSIICHAQITDPGWYRASSQLLVDAPLTNSLAEADVQSEGQSSPLVQTNVPAIPVAETITPQIQALANGLQNDPENIFDYVHDHIKFVLYFGAKKGAELTLLEKSGNDFDQSALLVALLRAAGYANVQYQFGWEEIPYDDPYGLDYDLHHWWQLTLNNTNWQDTVNYVYALCGTRGYPMVQHFGDGNTFEIQRTWVALTIGTTTYQLDPAFKISVPLTGISLTNAMGGGAISNALLAAASGTDTGNYTSGLQEATLRGALTGYTTNLLNYLHNNAPNYGVQGNYDDGVPGVLNSWQIIPANYTIDYSTTTWFYVDTTTMPVLSWANEPTNLMSTLKITFAGTNYQWFIPQLQGQRLALTFDGSGTAQLWQDDSNLVSRATGGSSGTTNVTLAVTHPVGSWNTTNNMFVPNPTNGDNMTVTNTYQRTNSTYALLYAFEPDWGWLQQRQNMLDTYLQEGLTNGSRQVTSETLNIMGLNWMLQTEQTEQMLAAQLAILPMYYHRLGRMAQETGNGYYVDVYMQETGEYSSGGNGAAQIQLSNDHFDLFTLFSSALENGIIEQSQNTNLAGASTVKMLEIANTNGQPVYLASKTNWTTAYDVESHLTPGSYNSTTLAVISSLVSSNFYVLLPQNGTNHVSPAAGSWAGYGYLARLAVNGAADISDTVIAGGFQGGYSGVPVPIDPPFIQQTGDNQPTSFTQAPVATQNPTLADPVDSADDTFQVEHTDLSVGQAEPHGITLFRYYNGTRRFSNPGGMSGGWIHNYVVNANTVAAPQAALGGTTPAQAAAMLTATTAAIAAYNGGYPDPKNWLTTALIAQWGIDQVTKSGVSVNLGKDTLQFIQQPNGTFIPPANCTATLTQTNSAYSLAMRHGNTFNFNASGLLTTLVDPYGQALNVSYTSNRVSTVSDWKGRQLTFNYTAGQLTSVSDGTRTVNYGYTTAYNSQGDLATFTDAEGKTTTYAYDTNHQITATIDALQRLVVSNLYDTQGHIRTQYSQGLTNKTWLLYWSGWQTTVFDPAAGEVDNLYDDQGRLTAVYDQLGNETATYYDGQNHVIITQSPLNEFSQYTYDGNNNLVQSVDPLGCTNRYVYSSLNNLMATVDPLGHSNTFGYNAQFSLTGQTNGAGDWVNSVYNSNGTLANRTDSGGETQYGYDSYGQANLITYPGTLGSESFVNSTLGDPASHTDANGNVTTFTYNNRRELTNSVAPTNIVTSLAYDPVGNVAATMDARANVTTNTWSATRHQLTTTLPATPQGVPVITNGYDNRDWLVRTADPLLKATLYTNDPDGHLIAATDPLLRTTTFSYDADGQTLAAVNAANETNSQTWDARGSLLRLTDGAGHYSTRAYDPSGNQIILTNRNGYKWQFQFDAANRLTNTITPLSRQTSVVFNHQGLPALLTDPMGQNTTNTFDGLRRVVSRADKVGLTTNSYDANNNLTNVFENGNTNVWSFDAYNRVSSYRDIYGNLLQYRYDANGNLTNLVYPGNKNVYYAYDSLNRLTNVTDWSSRKTTLTYDLDSHLTGITRPNGSFRTISYDAAGQVTNIWEQMANGLPIAWFRMNWTNSGNMAWEFAAPLPHTNTPPTRTMTYNADNQLATVNTVVVTSDPDGNLTYGPLPIGSSITGNLTNLVYDARNRLLNAGGVTNAYDAINNRIGQTAGTNTTVYVVNPNAKLPQVLMRIKNGVTNFYIYGEGLLYQITEAASGTNTLTYHYDYRGSAIALSSDSGLVTDRMEYSLYGSTTYRTGTNDTPFLFNGRYGIQTDANGLLYMQARYYNPYICRFINPDPSGFKGGLNFYAYANGNPISYLDPFGLNAAATGDSDNSWYYNELVNQSSASLGDLTQSPEEQNASRENYEATSQAAGTVGLSQAIVQFGSGAITVGDNGTIYTSGWGGNQYVSTDGIGEIADKLAAPLAGLSIGVDAYALYQGNITPTKFTVNTGFTGLGFVAPPFGATAAGEYFLIDTVYPGGWPSYVQNSQPAISAFANSSFSINPIFHFMH
jgi:RHS repeat-associated protein